MKKDVKYVAQEKFIQLVNDLGLSADPQKGFIKVQGPKGRQVYVAKTKLVGRVDLSGFEVREVPGFESSVSYLGGEKFGAVVEQLNMAPDRSEDDILADFAKILGHMQTLPPVEKKTKRTEKKAAPVEMSEEEKEASLRKRAKILKEVSLATGKPLSKEAADLVAAYAV